MGINPKTEALAFRIWAYAAPLGWNCTFAEAADHLGISTRQVAAVCVVKGWNSRFRANDDPRIGQYERAYSSAPWGAGFSDSALDALRGGA